MLPLIQAHFSLPHYTSCAAPISTGNVFRAGVHNSLPAVLHQHHSPSLSAHNDTDESQIKHKSRAVLTHSTLTDVTPRSSLRLAESLTLDPAHGQSMHSNSNSTGSRRGCQDDIGLCQPLLIRASRRRSTCF